MSIVQTRYRDIPYDEAAKCGTPAGVAQFRREAWEKRRGTQIAIDTPPLEKQWEFWSCDGPHYQIHGADRAVCPHIAEIGD